MSSHTAALTTLLATSVLISLAGTADAAPSVSFESGGKTTVMVSCDAGELPLVMAGKTTETANGKVFVHPNGVRMCRPETPQRLRAAVPDNGQMTADCPSGSTPVAVKMKNGGAHYYAPSISVKGVLRARYEVEKGYVAACLPQ
ncbi:hypothetical protein [Asticcacaulis sp. YBE204]|uniref:hypothetical protein n=1 Tax=Asticcacaulis sp. YBE204 TaxID=1282363 RepID=UPI0003C3C154|nr:hypothetical protein [Asticcacaulis sp. YBE204]ESQ80812.1 hypothetical protein AEYBE204_00390 [Asticcacaulis sp. YBE204]